ncbi:KptA family-domain-containing protein [Mycena belliarum]|uniref:2'-phosphotransferase n=1 Tax=Mycena belliarum TaxID=1033014 RepID=A0AAD6XSB7_9AGAR|nr:KptA family-domain-containing protein [Mycena belliae]
MQSEANTTPEKIPRSRKKPAEPKAENNHSGPSKPPNANRQLSEKLRGLPKDSPEVRVSKTLSWILRHGAKSEGLAMRPDGFVKVTDLLANPKLKTLDLEALQEIVKADAKQRYDLIFEEATDPGAGIWWMKANQGHSMKAVKLDLQPITSVSDIPTGIAVHGTTKAAWDIISTQGLSKMKRNHIHLAQGVVGENVISGESWANQTRLLLISMIGVRGSSQIFIFIDVERALDQGITFFLSNNGVILTEGDEQGMLGPRVHITGWEGEALAEAPSTTSIEYH